MGLGCTFRFPSLVAIGFISCTLASAVAAPSGNQSFINSGTFITTPPTGADLDKLKECRTVGKCDITPGNDIIAYPPLKSGLQSGCYKYKNKNLVDRMPLLGSPNGSGYYCNPSPTGEDIVEVRIGYRMDCPAIGGVTPPTSCDRGGYVSLGCGVRRVPPSVGTAVDRPLFNFECMGGNRIIVDSSAPGGLGECAAGEAPFPDVTGNCRSCGEWGGTTTHAGVTIGGFYKNVMGRDACQSCDTILTSTTPPGSGNGKIYRVASMDHTRCEPALAECDEPEYYEPDGLICKLKPCGPGTYRVGKECKACPIDTYKDVEGDQDCTMCALANPAPLVPPNSNPDRELGTWNADFSSKITGALSAMQCRYKVNTCESPATVASPPDRCNACVPEVTGPNSCTEIAKKYCQGVLIPDTPSSTNNCGQTCGFGAKMTGTDVLGNSCAGTCPDPTPAYPVPVPGVLSWTKDPMAVPPACAYYPQSCDTANGYTMSGMPGTASATCTGSSPSCTIAISHSTTSPVPVSASNGSIIANVTGAAGNSTIVLMNPPSGYPAASATVNKTGTTYSHTFMNLPASTYIIGVTDTVCTQTRSVPLVGSSCPIILTDHGPSKINPTPPSGTDGQIGLTISGAVGNTTVTLFNPPSPYANPTSYTNPTGVFSGPVTFSNLPANAASYDVQVTDSVCTQTIGIPLPLGIYPCSAITCPGATPSLAKFQYSQDLNDWMTLYTSTNPSSFGSAIPSSVCGAKDGSNTLQYLVCYSGSPGPASTPGHKTCPGLIPQVGTYYTRSAQACTH